MERNNASLNKQKKILFDLSAVQPVGNTKRHGGGKYGEIIFKRIVNRRLPIACVYNGNKWLNPEIMNLIKENHIDLYDMSKMPLQEIVDNYSFSVVFSPLPNGLPSLQDNVKVIGTVHGLRRLETPADSFCFRYRNTTPKDMVIYAMKTLFPNLFRARLCRHYLKDWVRPNFQIVTVSNHTANAIKYFLPELKTKSIPVFYSPSTSVGEITQRKYDEKYFMLVSGNRCDKNNLRAIMALDDLFDRGYLQGYKVKITGAKDSFNYRYSIRNRGRFEFLGYVDDTELEQLYHDAYSLVYPSLNEGFGYPPLEAMHYGVPVLASSYSSISEVCQGAVMYFNPFAIEEIANRILQISIQEVHEKYSILAKRQYQVITEKQAHDLDALIDFIYEQTV